MKARYIVLKATFVLSQNVPTEPVPSGIAALALHPGTDFNDIGSPSTVSQVLSHSDVCRGHKCLQEQEKDSMNALRMLLFCSMCARLTHCLQQSRRCHGRHTRRLGCLFPLAPSSPLENSNNVSPHPWSSGHQQERSPAARGAVCPPKSSDKVTPTVVALFSFSSSWAIFMICLAQVK